MRNEDKNLPTDTRRIDGFEGFRDDVEGDEREASPRVIHGKLVKFTNEATWVTGDSEELPPDLELLAVDIGRVVQRWKEGVPIETIILAPEQKYPDVKKLNAEVPKKEWEKDLNGKPRGPWQAQHIVYMLNIKTMDRYSYPTGTIGGSQAVRDLVDRTKWMRRFRGKDVFPVVHLVDTFMPTQYGGRQRPHFDIARWVRLGDDGKAVPVEDTPLLPDQGAQEVTPPSAKEVTDDEIRY
jgi:hypothetical protein